MSMTRAAIGICGLALLGLIFWAALTQRDLHGGFMEQFSVVATLPWGVVSLVDLYVGFVLFAALVFLTERSWLVAALWAAPVFVLGNVWSALWFVIRLPHLAKRLSNSDWPAS